MMKCVYVAGAYSNSNLLEALNNMRRGIQLSYDVLKHGFAPFVPWFDYHFSLVGEMTIDEYYNFCMAWLEKADAVLVVKEGYETSKGTLDEIKRAKELGIPVFFELEKLIEWRESCV